MIRVPTEFAEQADAFRAGYRQAMVEATRLLLGKALSPAFGAYRWEVPQATGNLNKLADWLGRPIELGEAFEAQDTWANIAGPSWQLPPWADWVKAKPGRNLVLGVPVFPKGLSNGLARVAAGEFDAHFVKLAGNLMTYGLTHAYLRVGWEFDGGWYAWGAPANQDPAKHAQFAAAFRRIVETMRQAQPEGSWKFVWGVADTVPNEAYLAATYPGDDVVDFCGVDLYDQSWAPEAYPIPADANDAERARRYANAWAERSKHLTRMRDFARSRNKPLCIPEWGVVKRSDGKGGGDNVAYIEAMYDFIHNPENNVAWHVYFDVDAEDGAHQLSPGADGRHVTKFPKAAARFLELFRG